MPAETGRAEQAAPKAHRWDAKDANRAKANKPKRIDI
jgi:hypothetical protein